MLKRCRYPFRWQWPVRRRMIHTTCFRCNPPYSLGPVVIPGCLLIARSRFAFSLPIFQLFSHFVLAMDLIDLFWADFIFMAGGVVMAVAAVFAAWSACSFPSMFLCPGTHSMWMVHVGLASWILSIVFRISLTIYWPDDYM